MNDFIKHLASYIGSNKSEFISYIEKMYGKEYALNDVSELLKEFRTASYREEEKKHEELLAIRAETIQAFANAKAFDLTQQVLSIVRSHLSNPSDSNIETLKEKMLLLDFIEQYEIDDIAWDWIDDYYGYYDEPDPECKEEEDC